MKKVYGVLLGIGIGFVLFVALVDVGRVFHPTRKLIDKGHGSVGTITYQPGTWKNLCEHELPEGFRGRVSMDGSKPAGFERYGVQVFTHSNSTEQMISLIKWSYHLKVDPDDVRIEEKERKRTWFLTGQEIDNYYETTFHQTDVKELFFTIYYYIPFFYARHVPKENRSLILRGMKLKGEKYLETEKTRIWVWYGDFQKLAFDKRQDQKFLHYIIEMIHFNEPKSGAVALIQNKDPNAKGVYIQYTNPEWTEWKAIEDVPWDFTDATLFALTTVDQGKLLNQEEFETFLKSVNFNAKVYDVFVLDRRWVAEFNKQHPKYPIQYEVK